MIRILSTKVLSALQKQLISNTINLDEYNAITISNLTPVIHDKIPNAIITSQNSARVVIKAKIHIDHVYCVGQKTADLLKSNGYNVVKESSNALVLGNYIVKNKQTETFVYLCGDKRRDELPTLLNKEKVFFVEQIVYKTSLNLKSFKNTTYQGVLFFSPSAVASFFEFNKASKMVLFCIGNTTAMAAKKHSSNIIVSKKTTIESLIESVNNYYC